MLSVAGCTIEEMQDSSIGFVLNVYNSKGRITTKTIKPKWAVQFEQGEG